MARSVVASSGSGGFGGGQSTASLSPDAALIAVIVWLVGALAVAAVFTRRAEIRS